MEEEKTETVTIELTVKVRYSGAAGKRKALQDLKGRLMYGCSGIYSAKSFGVAKVTKAKIVDPRT